MEKKKGPIKTSEYLETLLKKMVAKGLIISRTENNQYLKLSYKGSSEFFNPKWNIKIYTTGTVTCTDIVTLRKYALDKLKPPDESLILIKIDDSGWGFPLCGILVGVEVSGVVYTDEVSVRYFKPGPFKRKEYLKKYSEKGLRIITQKIKADYRTHRIEICNGFVNTVLKEDLQELGYDVRSVEITGLLQDSLEKLFKDYIKKKTGVDLAYDPKKIGADQLSFEYYNAFEWGKSFVPHLLKSGWRSMKNNGVR